jgi:biopolymer transport protein ExbB
MTVKNSFPRGLFFTGLVFALAILMPSVALGQEDAAAVPDTSISVADIFKDGGTIGWIIVVLSVVALALSIEDAVNIRKDKLAPPELIDEIEALFEAGDFQEAIELCEAEPNFFTNVVAAGLPKLNASFEAMEKALEEMTEEEALKLHTKVGWLSFIAAVSPMLGLLGTVTGMIQAFKVIAATKGQADPSQLSSGISGALVTTMFGLIVALPVTFAFTLFRNKVVKMTIEIGAIVEDLFERFRPTKAVA